MDEKAEIVVLGGTWLSEKDQSDLYNLDENQSIISEPSINVPSKSIGLAFPVKVNSSASQCSFNPILNQQTSLK